MHIFFCENLNSESVRLSPEESKHAIRVLRLRVGDHVKVTDGKGKFCDATVQNSNAESCELNIVDCTIDFQKRNYHFHIAIAPTKQMERFEWFLEKAVELGVDEITPLICHDSVRIHLRGERLQKIIFSAVKQSVQAYVPKLNDAITINDFVKNKTETVKMIAHCAEGNKKLMQELITKNQDGILLIGPEGDFTSIEISLALQNNFLPVSLGESRLRTETAGVYACGIMRMINS